MKQYMTELPASLSLTFAVQNQFAVVSPPEEAPLCLVSDTRGICSQRGVFSVGRVWPGHCCLRQERKREISGRICWRIDAFNSVLFHELAPGLV